MADVHLRYLDEVHIQIVANPGIVMELVDHFTHKIENYKFHPKVKARMWDGNISLVHRLTGVIYAGLAYRVKKYCDSAGYALTFDDELAYDEVSEVELKDFIASLGLPADKEQREYQFQSVLKCIRSRRRTLLSPTSSGKSLIAYLLTRWYNGKTLIIVPTTGLVEQLASDFRAYGFQGVLELSTGGLDRSDNIPADVVVTTWQALEHGTSKVSKSFYDQFKVVIGDEAHGCKATSLVKILSAMKFVRYRFGMTGTLADHTLNTLTIEGLFGPQYRSITTRDMIDQGYASDIKIKCIVLRYPEEVCKRNSKLNYADEVDFLINSEARNKFIANLARSLEKNKLVFFRRKEHGLSLYELLKDGESTFYIDGDVKVSEREAIRHAIEDEENATLIASLGTTSTGISINRLKHMIAGHPSKSKVKVLQSIGRMLRQHAEKVDSGAFLYDIVDDMSYKSHRNFTLNHFEERVKMYDAEQFEYKIYTVRIKHD